MNYMYTTLILHSHLPYVRHLEGQCIEERWLYEAMAESYIPLLWQLEKEETIRTWTISFSPTLMEMLVDPLLQQRFIDYIETTESLLQKELEVNKNIQELNIILFYINRYKHIKQTFFKWKKNLLSAFRHFFEHKKIECITTSATHAILPYMATKQGVKSQIKEGISCFRKHFGRKPKGFWLPECAFSEDIDQLLSEEGILYTFVDSHAVLHAYPTPTKLLGAPIKSPHGIVLFPRNQELSNKVWSATVGYPGDDAYREFYRDLGYDREFDYIKPFLPLDGIRTDTGLKYYKITGFENKELYNCEYAKAKVAEHAEDFLNHLETHLQSYGAQSFPPYHVVLPFDTELFGHWWFEGPEWLEAVLRTDQPNIEFITCSEFISRHHLDIETCDVSFSTWGRAGYGDVWLNDKNHWIYRYNHHVEKKLVKAVNSYKLGTQLELQSLRQMVREWFLLTSSDWAFMLDNENCQSYVESRYLEHVTRFLSLYDRLHEGTLTTELIDSFGRDYPFLTEIDLDSFLEGERCIKPRIEVKQTGLRILMLSWEFPPLVVGGLSRHVYDLSKALAKAGHAVTVITTYVEDYPSYEVLEGVEVYRVKDSQSHANDFLDWVGSLNMSLADQVVEITRNQEFDIIHAHDWLVAVAAISLKEALQKPLIATIHATEYGRNNGIYTSLQNEIHLKEETLVDHADSVIVCSDYMEDEVIRLFSINERKVHTLPNGVDPMMLSIGDHLEYSQSSTFKGKYSHIVFSVGRIVQEKGFETVIKAAPLILNKFPNVLFLIAGKGPMLHEYRNKVKAMGLEHNVNFIGYISDRERNQYFHECDITLFPSIYEPFGIVALEGMVACKPTIVSYTGGLKDIVIHGETGLTMIPGDEESLAEQVLFLLSNSCEAENIGRQGQTAAITTYSWDKIAEDTIKLFKANVLNSI